MKFSLRNTIAVLFVIMYLSISATFAQTTEFTYQGKLTDATVAASGTYDFEFRLFAVSSGGSNIGLLSRPGVVVTNGVFTVNLDFGNVFTGASRFLEIGVKKPADPSFITLTPRQSVTSAPYSVRSLNATTADSATLANNSTQLGGVAANQYVLTGDARLSDARNPLPGSGNYIQNGSAVQASSNFNISGTGTAGTLNVTTQFNIGGLRVLGSPGTGNLFAGIDAGDVNTGTNNSFFGRNAGKVNTSGSSNSFFGASAGFSNTTASNNAFFGVNAGGLNTVGFNNSFFGTGAGDSNTNADNNSFFGTSAGAGTTTGGSNSFFGSSAGFANTSGVNNAFFGVNSGSSNTTGFNNTFYGTSSGDANTIGQNNTFIGRSAGLLNTTGSINTFVGVGSGNNNSTAGSNTFVGANAGFNTTTGAENAFFGEAAGFINTDGVNNAFFGQNAGANNAGDSNAFFGHNAGGESRDGIQNSFVGASAGSLNSSGSFNTFIGVSAGNTNTTGNANTIIGENADVSASGLTFATAIGALAVVSASNTIVLGRTNGADIVVIHGLGTGGFAPLCQNASDQITSCSSSLRYKSNIRSFTSGLDLIRKLRPVSFNWNEGGMADMGLVAEEVNAAEPLLTTSNKKGEIEGVKYDRISVVLVNALKEQQAEIEAQRAVIRYEDERLNKLEAEIAALKKHHPKIRHRTKPRRAN